MSSPINKLLIITLCIFISSKNLLAWSHYNLILEYFTHNLCYHGTNVTITYSLYLVGVWVQCGVNMCLTYWWGRQLIIHCNFWQQYDLPPLKVVMTTDLLNPGCTPDVLRKKNVCSSPHQCPNFYLISNVTFYKPLFRDISTCYFYCPKQYICIKMTVYWNYTVSMLCTRWFKYDRDDLCVNKSQFVPVIFEPPCTILAVFNSVKFEAMRDLVCQPSTQGNMTKWRTHKSLLCCQLWYEKKKKSLEF
jgi:hypothetical protein